MLINNVLLLGLAAGICTVIGAALLFVKKNWSNRSLAAFLGLASGVMIAVVLFDMLPSALISGYVSTIKGIITGILILALLNKVILKEEFTAEATLKGLGYLIMLGIAMHDLPEGMAIALGDEMKARTGMVIAMGIGIHNIPEGMAIAAPLIMAGVSKMKIFFQVLLLGIITPFGTLIGSLAITVLPGLLPGLLGLASGIMLYLVWFQLWPQARLKDRKSRWWGFWLGMVIIFSATFM